MDNDVRLSLVEQNYEQLNKRLEKVEEKIDHLRDDVLASQHSMTKVIIGAAGTIFAGLLSTIVVLLLQ
jgi:tetrahydromethanopterin S-methyltransferase subunit G